MNPSLRRATDSDIEVYLEIERAIDSPLNLVTTSPEEARQEIANSVVSMIVYEGQVVGFIAYEVRDTLNAHVAEVAILPDYQGKGIGSHALEMTLDELVQKGFKFVDLETHPENKAKHLYERCGFQVTGLIENYKGSGTPRLTMSKALLPGPQKKQTRAHNSRA